MSGDECWRLVGPIIAAHTVVHTPYQTLGNMDEAYITVYTALKLYDKQRVKELGERINYEQEG